MNFQPVIGEIIVREYNNDSPDENIFDSKLLDRIENLIDIILSRAVSKGLEYTAHSVFDELFEIRMMILNNSDYKDMFFSEIDDLIMEDVSSKLEDSKPPSKIERAYIISMELYHKIINPIISQIKGLTEEDNNEFENVISEIPSYASYLETIEILPIPNEGKNLIKNYQNSSLLFDFYSLVFNLSENYPLVIKDKSKFCTSLYDSIEDFAYYAALLGVWNIDDDDETSLVRNIKIRLSIFELLNSNNTDKGESIDNFKNTFF